MMQFVSLVVGNKLLLYLLLLYHSDQVKKSNKTIFAKVKTLLQKDLAVTEGLTPDSQDTSRYMGSSNDKSQKTVILFIGRSVRTAGHVITERMQIPLRSRD